MRRLTLEVMKRRSRSMPRGLTAALAIGAILAMVLAACSGEGASAQEETEDRGTLAFAYDGWSGTYLPTYVLKTILEEDLGYTVEVVDASTVPGAFRFVAEGRADIFTSGWFPSRDFTFAKHPQLVKLGQVYGGKARDAYEGWMVPQSIAQSYNVRRLGDLRDEQVARALDTDGDGKGNIIGCPRDWACAQSNPEILDDYGLSRLYELQPQASEQDFLSSVRQMYESDRQAVFYMLQPAAFTGGFSPLDRATWLEGTREYLPLSFDRIIVRSDFIANHPDVAALLDAVRIPGADIAETMGRVKEDGTDEGTLTDLARTWITSHRGEVDSWLAAARQ